MSFFNELKRRNVFRVAIAYAVVAWLVLQIADVILNNVSAPEWVFWVTLMLLAIGFLIVVVFSWAFELTPEGLKRERDVDRSQSITSQTGKKLNRLIIGVLVLALAYFAFDRFVLSGQRQAAAVEAALEQAESRLESTPASVTEESDKSIAVLPFVNMSDDASNEFFSDGISEELLNLLAKIPELRVISRSSAFSYKGKDFKISDVGRELKVAHVLEGSVRKAGSQVRITAQLIRVDDDMHVWSETYDRSLDNIFAIQDEIAAKVVDQLKVTLLAQAPHAQETDPEAYALYLQARQLGRQNTVESLEQSNDLYQQALTIDPNYAPAWSGLCTNYSNQANNGLLPPGQGYSLAREAAENALSIDPDYALSHAGLGFIAMYYDNDLVAAARHYERAMALEPGNLAILGGAASLLFTLGRLEESIALDEYTNARDPVNPISYGNLSSSYLSAGRWDATISAAQTALRLSPGYISARYYMGLALLFKGEAEAALAAFEQEKDEEYRVKGQALALHDLGRQAEFEVRLQELIDRWGDQWPSEVAHVYAYAGDTETAFQWLEKSSAEEDGTFIPQSPFLRSLREDARWLPLLETIGKSPEQLAAVEFKVTLPK